MPALFHLIAHGLLGSLLAWCSRPSRRHQGRPLVWPVLFGVGYAVTVLLPLCAYQFRFHPDFSLSYAFDPVLYPWTEQRASWLCLAAACSNMAALGLGYRCSLAGLRGGRRWLAALAPTTALAVATWALFRLGARSLLIGDYTAFWRGTATPWTGTPSGIAVAAGYVLALVALRCGMARWRHRDPWLLGHL